MFDEEDGKTWIKVQVLEILVRHLICKKYTEKEIGELFDNIEVYGPDAVRIINVMKRKMIDESNKYFD